jgi:hypothetical protein
LTSSRASAVSRSGLRDRATGLARSARSTRTAAASSSGTGHASRSTKTSEASLPLVSEQMEFPLMPSAVASPVRTSRLLERALALRALAAGSGQSTPDLLASFDPRVAIVENVTALLNRGLDVVLRDLAALGYDAEWHCIQASDVGAPHRRDRIWIVALGNADQSRLEGRLRASLQECASQLAAWPGSSHWIGCSWVTEPDVGRVAVGVSSRVDRLRSLGNAVVPQIVETIGWALR